MSEVPKSESFECCGVRIDGGSLAWAVDRIIRTGKGGQGLAVHLCNAYTLSLAMGDDAYRRMLNRSGLNLPDGTPVAWVGRLLGRVGQRPVPGPSLMAETFRQDVDGELRHFLLGSSEVTLDALEDRLSRLGGSGSVVGRLSPPFIQEAGRLLELSVEAVRETDANIVWVGLGTPKQDWVADGLASRAGVVAVPVGAAFDFLAGQKPEAPRWIRGSGFEWVFRLATEPKRLWKRYLIGNPLFIFGAVQSLRSNWSRSRRGTK